MQVKWAILCKILGGKRNCTDIPDQPQLKGHMHVEHGSVLFVGFLP